MRDYVPLVGFHGSTTTTQELHFFIGSIGSNTTEEDLCAAFARVDIALKSAHIVLDRATGCSRGFAFVSIDAPPFGPSETPDELLERMSGARVNDRASIVRFVSGPCARALVWSPGSERRADGHAAS